MSRGQKHYTVKRGSKVEVLSKEEIKERNLALVMEYKSATPKRRGEILSEYYHLNLRFVTYFPKFHGDYREEIINTFVTMLPEFFMRFDPTQGIDLNSYLAMFAKKNAVREFLYLITTVQHNRWFKDKNGKMALERPIVVSIDSNPEPRADDDDEDAYGDRLQGKYVFRDFLNSGSQDGAGTFLEGHHSYSRYFKGIQAVIVRDFESGLKWMEVFKRTGLSMDRFRAVMFGIMMQLQRLLKEDGRNVRFIGGAERSARAARERLKPRRPVGRRPSKNLSQDWRESGGLLEDGLEGDDSAESAFGGNEAQEDQGPVSMEGYGPEVDNEGEEA